MLNWLQKILGLPRLDRLTLFFGFLFLFVAVPLLSPAIEQVVEGLVDQEHYLLRAGVYLGLVGVALVATGLLFHYRRVFRPEEYHYRNPAPTRHLVMLGSANTPSADRVQALCREEDRWALFRAISALAREDRGPRWLELVIRAIEHHRPRLEQLTVLVTLDGLGAPDRVEDRRALERLLEHYLSLRTDPEPVAELVIRSLENSMDLEVTRSAVDRLQRGHDPDEMLFDLTLGTKPMSAGMVLACLDDRFDLQYFVQIPQDQREQAIERARRYARTWKDGEGLPASSALAVAWGRLPIEREHGVPLEQCGLLPILVDTDAEVVQSRLSG